MTDHPSNQVAALKQSEIDSLLKGLEGWQQQERSIYKTYVFDNYYQTIAFVNALAWMTHGADHHPELTVTYNRCRVCYSTHSVGGLSINDFSCAARADALFTS
jgi:4a-hydroxytetrahydrobiopterin dehydratase